MGQSGQQVSILSAGPEKKMSSKEVRISLQFDKFPSSMTYLISLMYFFIFSVKITKFKELAVLPTFSQHASQFVNVNLTFI